ncbi:MAG TPA: RsmD family RNA methyltransferase [Candidatus Limnocylindrales bacterium]|nr:RsmD family RNA methyltransferase [Candidatus Limnocylindrales bacterium]
MADAGRVIAGTARGVRLAAPGEGTRPLADRVKQTLFAVLEAGTLGPWPADFLDLFAGSGAGGIEALSRDAARAVFVERDGGACRVIDENLRRARLTDRARVVRGEVLRTLAGDPAALGGPFGAALLDPPYGDAAMLPALERLAAPEPAWLTPSAVVVAKHFWRDPPPERVGWLVRRRVRRFGETMLSFYVLDESPREERP